MPATPTAPAAASLRLGAALLIGAYGALLGASWVLHGHSWFITAEGHPAPADFAAYRVAGTLALEGEAAAAYDWGRFSAALASFLGRDLEHWLGWLNPPSFLLVVAPLATLPYEASALLWLGATGVAYALAARAALPGRAAALLALAAPATLACVVKGQNGLLSAALIGYALVVIGSRPVLAGICIGALSFKPHFGLVLPVLLMATGQWRAFAAAVVTVVALAALSLLAFGTEAWTAFLDALGGTADRFLIQGAGRAAMQSIYAFAAPHLGHVWAMLAHGTLAAFAAGACALLWMRGSGPEGAAAAAAIAATFLATPYAFNHDAPMLAIAALLCLRGETAQRAGSVMVGLLTLAVLLPGVTLVTQHTLPGPAAALTILAVAWRLSASSRKAAAVGAL